MTEDEFLQRWDQEQPVYEAWGKHVVAMVEGKLKECIDPIAIDVFLRLPPKPRVKAHASILEKAFYRNTYDDAYTQITDKVGVRFIVLLLSDIEKVERAILLNTEWSASKDRDYEKEWDDDPLSFSYSAVHYVVRPLADIQLGEITVPLGSPCEIQIKTILQHAYSELTHDTIYKPQVEAAKSVHRAAAKSMALIEATNDYFENVASQVQAEIQPARQITDKMALLYRANVKLDPVIARPEAMLVSAFSEKMEGDLTRSIMEAVEKHPFIGERIAEKARRRLLFRQPSILFVYAFVSQRPSEAKRLWPLTPEEIRPIFTDLGIAFDNI